MKKSVFVFLFLIALVPILSIVSAGIGAEANQTPFKPHIVPGRIEAEDFDNGGQNVAYKEDNNSIQSASGSYRSNYGVDVFYDAVRSNSNAIGWTYKGEWLEYTINVTKSGVYRFQFNTGQPGNGAKMYLMVNGLNVTKPFDIPNTGNWHSYTTFSPSQTAYLNEGSNVLTVYMFSNSAQGAVANFDYLELSLVSQNQSCDVLHRHWNQAFTTNHNSTGLRSSSPQYGPDNRFLCYSGRLYECGWELSNNSFAYKLSNGEIIAGWKCNLAGKYFTYSFDVPASTVPSTIVLNYGQSYSGFEIYNDKSYNGSYGVLWIYNFTDGTNFNETQYFGPGSGSNNFISFSKSFVSPSQVGKTLYSVSLYPFFNATIPAVLNSPRNTYLINYSTCSNECNLLNEQQCFGGADNTYRVCGNYDLDVCYEWSTSVSACGGGMFCNSASANKTNLCNIRGSSNCLVSEGRFCSTNNTIFGGFNYTSGNCGSSGSTCFECNVSAGYTLDFSTNSSCKLSNCSEGQHVFNNVCISNNCSGVSPSGTNLSIGSAIYTVGNLSWAHVYGKNQVELTSCQWSCAAGFKPNLTGSGCEVGKPICSLFAGNCTNSTLSLGNFANISNWGLCTTDGDSCIKCNGGYVFNGSQCAFVGVAPSGNCSAGKCFYNNSCFNAGFRFQNTTGKFFCNSTMFVAQGAVNSTCINNYQCESNFCDVTKGKCIALVKTVNDAAPWYRKVYCWITNSFSTNAAYAACLGSGAN